MRNYRPTRSQFSSGAQGHAKTAGPAAEVLPTFHVVVLGWAVLVQSWARLGQVYSCQDPTPSSQSLSRLAPRYTWTIIDGPPGIGRVSADTVRASDLVLIPSKPSPFDVWAASDIVDAVRARQATTGGTPRAFFVITMARTRTLLVRQIRAALSEYELPVLGARTTERVAYPMTAIEGKSVLDSRDRAAQHEILAMRDEIERLADEHAQ